jgi:outer membrane murein-binding lipoprotein Lpp
MSLTKRVGPVAGAVALALTGASYGETGTNDQNLQARIAELEATVAQLKSQDDSAWLTTARASEIRALVQDVLQDADTRQSLLGGGIAGGHDGNGFFIGTDDGSFRLNVGGQMQARYMINFQDDGDTSFVDETRGGFENTRTKLILTGNVLNPDWTYRIESNFGQAGFDTLEDAWINYGFSNGWSLTFGQFKLPGLREEMIHSSMQQAVERSLINSAFSLDRSQGIMVNYEGENFRFSAAFSDGARGLNSPSLGYDTEYALSARAEVLFAGTWDQFDDFASWKGDDFGFLLGGAVHYQDGEYGTTALETSLLGLTVDAQVEFGGANLFGAFVWTDIDSDSTGFDANPWGFVIQGGFFLTEDWELFARFEYGDADDLVTSSSEDLMLLTIGATKYWDRHNLKWTTDIGFGFDEVDSAFVSTPDASLTGWRGDLADEDGQIVLRTQLQLLF